MSCNRYLNWPSQFLKLLLSCCCLFLLPNSALAALKVFILAGQSNMIGHGHARHLRELVMTGSPEWTPYWNNELGNFSTRNDVFVNQNGIQTGNLTMGFGDDDVPVGEAYFGPELGFGWFMGEFYNEPVLLIKSAWGALSLAVDFRSPSSGTEGWQWIAMLNLIHGTLSSLGKYVPGYKKRDGYEIAGFVWLQGEADAYTPSRVAEYKSNLINFILDIRSHLSAPNLPFIIGEIGEGGANPDEAEVFIRQIQRDVANSVPNTRFVPTSYFVNNDVTEVFEPYFHYYGRADVFIRMGRSFARNILVVKGVASAPTVSPSAFLQPSATTRVNSEPTAVPSLTPVTLPPTLPPSLAPSFLPTTPPTPQLTNSPTWNPTAPPSVRPIVFTASQSTLKPTAQPTLKPSLSPRRRRYPRTQTRTVPSAQQSSAPPS